MSVSLLEKTGIQFVRGSIEFRREDLIQEKLLFEEYVSPDSLLTQVRPLLHLPDAIGSDGGDYFSVAELVAWGVIGDGFVKEPGAEQLEKLKTLGGLNDFQRVSEVKVERASLSESGLRKLSRQWLPLPLAQRDHESGRSSLVQSLGSRLWFECKDGVLEYVIAIDTDGLSAGFQPQSFVIGSAPEMVDKLLSRDWAPYLHAQWMRPAEDLQEREENLTEVAGQWDAVYRLFLGWFKEFAHLDFSLAGRATASVAVCAYIDFGNESTSVLLREETPTGQDTSAFDKIKELELFDFGSPLSHQRGPFSTNAAFREGKFLRPDTHGVEGDNMIWLSPLALGQEAARLLSSEGLARAAESRPMGCHSPKRFLWDHVRAQKQWVFASSATGGRKPVHVTGVTDRMTAEGRYVPKGVSSDQINPTKHYFSRQSISTFVFVEICTQIHRQINSPAFRESHGELSALRILNRVVISCPTGMSKIEQTALRKACEEALFICQDNLEVYAPSLDERRLASRPVVVPSSAEIGMDNDQIADRTQWGVDEATLGQILWMYTELVHRRGVNSDQFLRDFGKEDTIRVASVDVGAGTTDIMVCDHRITSSNELVKVRPEPVFWDSILKAGDDLVEEVIRKVLLVGSEESKGILLEAMEGQGVTNAHAKIVDVFGKNHANQTVADQAKRQFVLQKLITPLAKHFLEGANRGKEISFATQEVLGDRDAWSKDLTKHFKSKLGVDLQSIAWQTTAARVNRIAIEFFKEQWKVISEIFEVAKPDVVLLAGGVFQSEALSRLMAQYSGTSLSRIVNMNNYVIGRWFPFVDGHGTLVHAKSVVSVGIAIADLAERNLLRGFQLDTDMLITNVKNDELHFYSKRAAAGLKKVMSSSEEDGVLNISQIPARLLTSPVDSPNYPKKDCYRLDFDWSKISLDLSKANPDMDPVQIEALVREQVSSFRLQAPFRIDVNRYEEDREQLVVAELEREEDDNARGRRARNKHFVLRYESLPGGDLWMEKGVNL